MSEKPIYNPTHGVTETHSGLAQLLGVGLNEKAGSLTKAIRWLTRPELEIIWTRINGGQTPLEAVSSPIVAPPTSAPPAGQAAIQTAIIQAVTQALGSIQAPGITEERVCELLETGLATEREETTGAIGQIVDRALSETRSRVESMAETISSRVDGLETMVRERGTTKLEITVKDLPTVTMEERPHKIFNKVLKRLSVGKQNVMLVGPAGCGKTTLAAHLAKALSVEYSELSCSGGLSEWQLIGRREPEGDTLVYRTPEFVKRFENGGLMLLDELDASDANVLAVIQSALANGHLCLPARWEQPMAIRHPRFYLICAANTYGRGADRMYVGRNQLDAALLDRFGGGCKVISMDYDRERETELCPDETIRNWAWSVREKIQAAKMQRVMSTRFLEDAYALVHGAEVPFEEVKQDYFGGWSKDEIARVS